MESKICREANTLSFTDGLFVIHVPTVPIPRLIVCLAVDRISSLTTLKLCCINFFLPRVSFGHGIFCLPTPTITYPQPYYPHAECPPDNGPLGERLARRSPTWFSSFKNI